MDIYKVETIASVENTRVVFVDEFCDDVNFNFDSLNTPIISRTMSEKIKRIELIDNCAFNHLIDIVLSEELSAQFADTDDEHISKNVMKSMCTSLIIGRPSILGRAKQ